ncbi:MAG: 3,4-dehydroadipyl-CoA semialdehyde dehydrogenase [Acidobacteriota bacterium]
MTRLQSYLCGRFVDGDGPVATLVNPSNEEPLAEIASHRSLADAVAFARGTGGPALHELSFRERGERLKKMATAIHGVRDELIGLAIHNGGNTRSDAKFDIDGASGTLAYYGDLGISLGDGRILPDGDGVQLTRSPRLYGRHVHVSRAGVAVHINAFNFPAWGAGEKLATAILAGMPVITKPATATALVAHRMCQVFVEQGILPAGALSLLLGSAGDLVDHLGEQDVLAFTGSGDTGSKLRGHERILRRGVRVNVEADSLNAALLGPDVEPGSATWDMAVNEISRDVTQKAGQKCTAIRRIFVPAAIADRLQEELSDRLSRIKVGNPELEEVTMGPVATASQLHDVREGLARLCVESRVVYGGGPVKALGAPEGKGFFVAPTMLRNDDAASARSTHELEVFGPIATLMPYDGAARTAVALVRRGAGGLVSSVYTDDRAFLGEVVTGIASHLGRVYIGSAKVADKAPGPGTVLPQLVHGGPGRAGGGEELGGLRGLAFYMQRTALEGDRALLDQIAGTPSSGPA